MKNRYKLLIICFVMLFVTFLSSINTIYAEGIEYIAWRQDVNGDNMPDLIFRRYSYPTSEMLEEYDKQKSIYTVYQENGRNSYKYTYNGQLKTAKWIYVNKKGIYKPLDTEFTTVGYTFHADYVTAYEKTNNSNDIGVFQTGYPTSSSLKDMNLYFSEANIEYVKPKDTATIYNPIYTLYGVNSIIKNTSWGTGVNMSSITPKESMVYRYSIVCDATTGKNVYVEDRVIYNEDLQKLRAAIGDDTLIARYGVYISDIVISDAKYDMGGYELSKTASQFFTQYKKYGYSKDFWPSTVRGASLDATQSVMSVFNNIMLLPQTSKKNILVRHVHLGENTILSKDTFNASTILTAANQKITYKNNADDAAGTKVTSIGSGNMQFDGVTYHLSEIYNNVISVEKYVEKEALGEYKCLGYNVSAAPSFKQAFKNISNNIERGKYSEGSIAKIDGLTTESEEECIVIDFYYTDGLEEVYVNHLFVDKNNKVLSEAQQNIIPNTYAYVGEPLFQTEYRAASPRYNSLNPGEAILEYVQEKYYRRKGQKLLVKTAFSLLEDRFTLKRSEAVLYKGYDVRTSYTNWKNVCGTIVSPSKDWWKPFDIVLGVIIPDGAKQVDFYYYNRDRDEAAPPTKFLDMGYFLTATYKGLCNNETASNIVSVPSGSTNVKQGLTNVPKAMVSAINLEKVNPILNTHFVNVTAIYKCGLDGVSFTETVGYNFGYYKVTELVAEGLQQITLYDDSSNRMFNNKSETYTYSYGNVDLDVSAATEMVRDSKMLVSDLDDWHHYVELKIKDNYHSEQVIGDNGVVILMHEFLTAAQVFKVDKFLDGNINEADWAVMLTNEIVLKGAVEVAQGISDAAYAVYGGAKILTEKAQANLNYSQRMFNTYKNGNLLDKAIAVTWAVDVALNAAALAAAKAVETAARAAWDVTLVPLALANVAYNEFLEDFEEFKVNYAALKPKYDEYRALEDATWYGPFIKSESNLAKAAGVNLSITVHNMHLKMNGEELNNKSSRTYSANLSEYMKFTWEDGFVTTIDAPVTKFDEKIYNGVGTRIDTSSFNKNSTIASNVKNGLRNLTAEVKYKTQVLIGKKFLVWDLTNIHNVEDNVYYSTNVKNPPALTNGKFTLDHFGLIGKTSLNANVYTPIAVNASLKSDNSTMVDQRESKTTSQTIQLGVPFTVTFGATRDTADKVYGITDMSNYVKGYYIKFDFDVHKVLINGVSYNSGNVIKAGTWIGMVGKGKTLTATVYADVTDANIDIANEVANSYVVRAIASNATSVIETEQKKFSTLSEIMDIRNNLKAQVTNMCTDKTTTGVSSVPSYLAEREYAVTLLNRMYDFKVTDVKDISWKSVFRTTTGATVNAHTGNVYYSGIYKWIMDSKNTNTMARRTPSEVGSNPVRTLPISAYKHSDLKYVKAPKLGYSFSYDLKVTGNYYDKNGNIYTNKKVDITTKFYYISDDGNTFLEEGKGGIYLFYKNEAGKYVRIDETGGGYKLSFIPNDGYRLVQADEKSTLSDTAVDLGNLRKITLKYNMATVDQTYATQYAANNGTVITYYGEYKLPNTTIAVKVNSDGSYDINKPLKNGYIGVVFDITAKTGKNGNIGLSYNENTKGTNTSQWDYEGYLGFANPGSSISSTKPLTMKLEGGTWQINNEIYNKIKGTVIMYDIDERAASDYE